MTNGVDFRTRQAVEYWKSSGLDVRSWVYRVYANTDTSFLLEMTRFAVKDNPYEDVAAGFYILNTNFRNQPDDHEDMIQNRKAAAYFSPWKYKIARIAKGDTVFLYQSGVGIVAVGLASGTLNKAAYHGDVKHNEEEYSMILERFQRVEPPVSAAKIKEITGTNYRFLGTMFSIDADSAAALLSFTQRRGLV